ncbi:hypothetical protein D9M72_532290 [compost metagenome]
MVDVRVEQRFHGAGHQGDAAEFQSGVDFGLSVARDIRPRVPKDRNAKYLLTVRRYMDKHQDVGALVSWRSGGSLGFLGPEVSAAVAAHYQDVHGNRRRFRGGRRRRSRCEGGSWRRRGGGAAFRRRDSAGGGTGLSAASQL